MSQIADKKCCIFKTNHRDTCFHFKHSVITRLRKRYWLSIIGWQQKLRKSEDRNSALLTVQIDTAENLETWSSTFCCFPVGLPSPNPGRAVSMLVAACVQGQGTHSYRRRRTGLVGRRRTLSSDLRRHTRWRWLRRFDDGNEDPKDPRAQHYTPLHVLKATRKARRCFDMNSDQSPIYRQQ